MPVPKRATLLLVIGASAPARRACELLAREVPLRVRLFEDGGPVS